MPLRLEPDDDPHPRHADFYELWSGRSRVGILRLEKTAEGKPIWHFGITIVHEKATGVPTVGGGSDKASCFANAQRCWADHVEAMGLEDAP